MISKKLKIKKIKPSDLIIVSNFHDNYFALNLIELQRFFILKNYFFLGIYCNENLLGFMILVDCSDHYNLEYLAIFLENQKRGYAKLLIQYLINNFNNKPIWLEVATTNLIAINLYLKFGFKTNRVRLKYYKNHENAFEMIYKKN